MTCVCTYHVGADTICVPTGLHVLDSIFIKVVCFTMVVLRRESFRDRSVSSWSRGSVKPGNGV